MASQEAPDITEVPAMINQCTVDKLISMRLTAMSDAFRIQMNDIAMKEVSFEDRFGLLVDVEYTSRKNNRLKRLIRNAELEQSDACIAGIDYTSGRKLNKSLIKRLATCEYIVEFRNIFITGATGSGKTYMACAFGMEACKQHITVKYVRLPDLLMDLEFARSEDGFIKVFNKYTKPTLLIIDEWLLLKLSEPESKILFELVHKRRKKTSTIFCSQFRQEGWYERLGGDDNPLADAIMDRIVYDAYKINIESIDPSKDISMREVYGLDQTQTQ
jgi:DNA replication protein DnaC